MIQKLHKANLQKSFEAPVPASERQTETELQTLDREQSNSFISRFLRMPIGNMMAGVIKASEPEAEALADASG